MRKRCAVLPLFAFLFSSCDQPFTPKAPFVSRPVVTCIVAGDGYGYTATATVAKTYDVPGLDPMSNTTDPFDTSAVVIVTVAGAPNTLKLRKSGRADTSRYTTKEYRFQGAGVLPYFSGGGLKLTITTGSGTRLTSATTVPQPRLVETDYEFVAGVTANTVQPQWTFNWDNGQRDDRLYFPRMLLSYQIIDGNATVYKNVEIPLTYVEKDGKRIPVYPSFTRRLELSYDFAAMTEAIAAISDGDSVKSRYKIGMLSFTLVEYDVHLSNYYSSSHGYLDQYSIRVDESTYSNVSGGIGIFGSYYTNERLYEMKTQYIRSFGYQK
jgi:hypothetical protein